MNTNTTTLISAMRILSREIQSGDGVANAAIAEAADRLEELQAKLEKCKAFFDEEIDTITKKWNKLYLEAKEACK